MWVTLRFKEKVAQLGPSDSAQGQGEGQGGAPLTEILSIKWNECIWDMVDAQDVEWGVCVCVCLECVRIVIQMCMCMHALEGVLYLYIFVQHLPFECLRGSPIEQTQPTSLSN